jgi:hypothetical protein
MLYIIDKTLEINYKYKYCSCSRPVAYDVPNHIRVSLKQQNSFIKSKAKPYSLINLLKPTGYVMHRQFNIQQLYALCRSWNSDIYPERTSASTKVHTSQWLL